MIYYFTVKKQKNILVNYLLLNIDLSMSAGLTLKHAKVNIRNKKMIPTIGRREPADRVLGLTVVRKFYNLSLCSLELKEKSTAQVVDSFQKALSFYLMLPKS